ncbi:hypothetical protein ACFVDU_05255 [Streptomyces albidoflavus]
MAWKREFEGELRAIRKSLEPPVLEPLKRLDDPTVGLAALYGAVTQGRMKVLEQVQGGVGALSKEQAELRRRQEEMISDLRGFRRDVEELAALLPLLRDHLGRDGEAGAEGGPEESGGSGAAQEEGAASPPVGSAHHDTAPGGALQGDSVENAGGGEQAQPEGEGLKSEAEAAYLSEVRGDAPGTRTSASGSGVEVPQPLRPDAAHGVLLLRAAGVASVDIVAHRDTWEWVADLAAGHAHFRNPSAVEDTKDGPVQTSLSGRSLIAVLIKAWETRSTAPENSVDWAMATTVYHRAAARLGSLVGEGEVIRIVLDDGADD